MSDRLANIAKASLGMGKAALSRAPKTKARLRTLGQMLVPPLPPDSLLVYRALKGADAVTLLRETEEIATWVDPPAISLVIPTYNTDPQFLREALDSIRTQIYPFWEAIVVDDCSPEESVRTLVAEYAAKDPRIVAVNLPENKMIAGATNVGIERAQHEWIGFVDHDDVLAPDALFHVAKVIVAEPDTDVVYTDEDFVDEDRHHHYGGWFKPDWNPDFLHSVNYITHFTVVRASRIQEVGGLRDEANGAQDWDLMMRLASVTDRFRHIPKLLYSWRVHSESTAQSTDSKPYVIEAQRRALSDDLARRGRPDATVNQDPDFPGYWQVRYPVQGRPLVSIVIPTKDQYAVVKRCVDSILRITTYLNFEIILVDTGSTERAVHRWYGWLRRNEPKVRIVDWPETPFSYSRACNFGAEQARGEILVMLNNDTEVLHASWLETLTGDAQRPEVGAVGALLLYPDRELIQHAGVGVGLGGLAANALQRLRLFDRATRTQHLMLYTRHNMSAVTGACLAIRKELFTQLGGFAEEFAVTYNDVDLCLRLMERGYVNVYLPFVRLLHHESLSLGRPEGKTNRNLDEVEAARALFRERWAAYIEHDPHLNAALDKTTAFYDVLPPVGTP